MASVDSSSAIAILLLMVDVFLIPSEDSFLRRFASSVEVDSVSVPSAKIMGGFKEMKLNRIQRHRRVAGIALFSILVN